MKKYPNLICSDCAKSNGGNFPKDHIASFYKAKCDVCEVEKTVTQPRDFCYPKIKGHEYASNF